LGHKNYRHPKLKKMHTGTYMIGKTLAYKKLGKLSTGQKFHNSKFVVISCAQFSSFEKNTTTSNIRYKKLCIIEGLTNSKGNLIVALVGSPKPDQRKELARISKKNPSQTPSEMLKFSAFTRRTFTHDITNCIAHITNDQISSHSKIATHWISNSH